MHRGTVTFPSAQSPATTDDDAASFTQTAVRIEILPDLADVVTHGIAVADGVRRTHTLVAFRTYRDADYAWDIGTD